MINIKEGDILTYEDGATEEVPKGVPPCFINDNDMLMVYVPVLLHNATGYDYKPVRKVVKINNKTLEEIKNEQQ